MNASGDPTERHEDAGRTVSTRKSRKFAFAFVALIVGSLVVLVPRVFLLFFCCVLFAVLLAAICGLIERRFPIFRKWALTITLFLLLGLGTIAAFLIGPQMSDQFIRFSVELPRAAAHAQQEFASTPIGKRVLESLPALEKMFSNTPEALTKATTILSAAAGLVVQFFVIFFVGVYLAGNPSLYTNSFARLFPTSKRERIKQVLRESGSTLQKWLCGRLILMGLNGIVTALGLLIMGIPLAITLGFLSALLNFIPNFGPIIAAIPAVLIALLEGPSKAFQVALFYFIYQMFDGYVLTPLVQRRTISLPPALILMSQVLFGVLFGAMGVLVAVPLAAVGLVLFREVYSRDVLLEE